MFGQLLTALTKFVAVVANLDLMPGLVSAGKHTQCLVAFHNYLPTPPSNNTLFVNMRFDHVVGFIALNIDRV